MSDFFNKQKIEIKGWLGDKPVMRYTQGGSPVTDFSVAVNLKKGDKEYTVWHKVTVWNTLAENCNKYLVKGQAVEVEGHVSAEAWADKVSGEIRSQLVITAYRVIFGPKPTHAKTVDEQAPPEFETNEYPF